MLNVVMLSVVMLNVTMLSVVGPVELLITFFDRWIQWFCAILSRSHLINLPLCQLPNRSICSFVDLRFHQLVILSSFLKLAFCQRNILSSCYFINLTLRQLNLRCVSLSIMKEKDKKFIKHVIFDSDKSSHLGFFPHCLKLKKYTVPLFEQLGSYSQHSIFFVTYEWPQ